MVSEKIATPAHQFEIDPIRKCAWPLKRLGSTVLYFDEAIRGDGRYLDKREQRRPENSC